MNNDLANADIGKKMITSLEIAEVTGKKHSHIMEAIRKMEPAWKGIGQSNFRLAYHIDAQGKPRPHYELTKTETLFVSTKFKDETRALLVLRWEALETGQAQPVIQPQFQIPQSFSEALMLAARQQEQIEQQQKLLTQKETVIYEQSEIIEQKDETIEFQSNELMKSAPKVNYYDQTLQSKDTMTISEIGNVYGLSGVMLNKKLVAAGIIYKRDPRSKLYLLKKPYSEWKLSSERTQTYTRTDGSIGTKHLMVYNERGRRFICALIENDFDPKKALKSIQGENAHGRI